MAFDVWIASFLINRWIAVPLLAAVWAFGHGPSEIDRDFAEAFIYACVYGVMGLLMRIGIEELIPARWKKRFRRHHPNPAIAEP
jgi:hypothetical protein